jgi:hypothetical protein
LTEELPAPIRRKMFVKPSPIAKLSADSLKRQSQITHLAYSLLGDPTQAIQFLNQSSPSLGGRPLEIATTSAAGYSSVEQAIRLLAVPHMGKKQ